VASPRLRVGTDYYAVDFDHYAQTVRVGDEIGFELIGHGDSQNLWHELYVALTVAALNTRRARIGPLVTNPVTRHPAVTAAAMASLQQLSHGRAVVGIGGGDSAVLNIGSQPARIDEVAEYVRTVRELTAGRPASYRGRDLRIQWADRPVPVFMAAEGPRKLRLAGAIADGVIVSNGITREVVQDTIRRVAEGARAAGRSADEVEIWWLVNFAFSPDVASGVESLTWLLAAAADHVFRFTLDGKHVPAEHADGVRELMARYTHARHALVDENPNGALVDELGLREWLAQRFAITGTPQDCVERIREIAGYGATNLLFTQLVPDQLDFMHRLRELVLDPLQVSRG
jgi:5,10-methylenetetrahydromethanopterin reductase